MHNIQIRQANIDDAENLLNYFKKVGSETGFLMVNESGIGLTIEEEIEFLKQYQYPIRGLYILAINDENTIVGQSAITQMYPHREKSSHVYRIGMCVLKDYWGRGIASKMMEELINHAKNIGCIRLELHVRTDNNMAIKLYKKFGFEIEGEMKRMMKIGNEYFDEYIMSLIM
jgi:RimJ/RimL family protein N-acetyltransferase